MPSPCLATLELRSLRTAIVLVPAVAELALRGSNEVDGELTESVYPCERMMLDKASTCSLDARSGPYARLASFINDDILGTYADLMSGQICLPYKALKATCIAAFEMLLSSPIVYCGLVDM